MTKSSNIILHELTDADRDLILPWRNAPEVRRHMYSHHEISQEEHNAWFERMKRDQSVCWYLCRDSRGEPVGVVYFTDINLVDGSAQWGFYANPKFGGGDGGRILTAALEHAFNELGLSKITGEVLAANSASLKLHRKCGFTQESVLYAQHFDGEVNVDVIRFVLRSREWRQRKTDPANS